MPTFHVTMDVPGASSALAVAQRFGLDGLVIERAREMLPEHTRVFDTLVHRLEAQSRALEQEREDLMGERRALAEDRQELESERARLREHERRKLSEEGQRLVQLIRETRDEVRAARAAMRKKEGDVALIEAARTAVERASQRVREEASSFVPPSEAEQERGAPVSEGALSIGMRVWVPRLRAELEVIDGPAKGRVRVASGAVKLWVGTDEVRVLSEKTAAKAEPARGAELSRSDAQPELVPTAIRTESNTLDLRGLRVDEALGLLESFLDRLYGTNEKVGFLVHGVGSGALRDAVRDYLRDATRYVRQFRPGNRDEGGDRLTVVSIS